MPILLPITLMFILPFGILFDSVLRHADRESSTWQAVARIGVIAGILAVLLTTLYGAMFLTSLFDIKSTLLSKQHYFLYFLSLAMYPKFLFVVK